MNKIQTYIDSSTLELLEKYAQEKQCSLSRAASAILSAHLNQEEKSRESASQNKQQFLRLLNILTQTFLCVYDKNKVSIESESAQECLELIKNSLDSF